MEHILNKLIKFTLISTIALMVLAAVFLAGVGSAYMLVASGVTPPQPTAVPTVAVPTAPPTQEEEATPRPRPTYEEEATPAPRPTPTPVPLPTPIGEDERTFQLFWEVWDLVQHNFYGELPDMQQVTYAAIQGMLSTLNDPYTAFIEPQAAAIMGEDATGEFEGIGAFVDMDEEGRLVIVDVFEGGPAEKAGVLAGDRVVEVDGVSIVGMTVYEAIGLIRGPAGSEVTLLIEREGVAEALEITVTRARLEIPVTESEMRDDGIGYIRLYDFSSVTASDRVEQDLREILAHDPRGVVLDLRGNPGGMVDQCLEIADLFLDDGAILIERWSDGREQTAEAHPGDIGEDVPLVVLVDGGSASASEIVAGALQDHERAMLVGETTFGKGAVQLVFELGDGSQLWVSAAHWFTPNDRAIQGQGLTPDIAVPWPEDAEPGTDPQLERAVQYLLTGE